MAEVEVGGFKNFFVKFVGLKLYKKWTGNYCQNIEIMIKVTLKMHEDKFVENYILYIIVLIHFYRISNSWDTILILKFKDF